MKAVLFDLDGVLIDSYNVWHAVINAFARDQGYAEITDEQMDAGWGQGVDADAEMFFPGSGVGELERYYNERFLDHLVHLEVTDGARSVLEELRRMGCRTAIVTNTPTALTHRLLERARLVPDETVGSSDVPHPKPAPDMVLRACELLEIAPREAAMIGDSAFDRDAASAAGVPFLSYRWDGGRRVDELEDVVDLVRGSRPVT
jgi:phosphoglycolate phosphatase/AHBA synthesis associated protein